jgi:RNA polymerase sigma factor (sigma-70 family)
VTFGPEVPLDATATAALATAAAAAVREDDRSLMAEVQRGDEGAFGRLLERWELPVKAVIMRLVLNASEAEDLAQETFVRVWQQRSKYRVGAEFRPWLFAIAVNLARNRLRWWRRRPEVALSTWIETESAAVGRSEVGAGELEAAERAAALRAAVAALPTDLREALVLFEYEELSHAEIADVVGASAKAVETRIYRAREKLREALAGWIE